MSVVRRTSNSAPVGYRLGLAIAAVSLLAGCATVEEYSLTYRVWGNNSCCKFSDPASNPNLALLEAANHADVLVRSDASSQKHSRVARHAYYLHPSQAYGGHRDGRRSGGRCRISCVGPNWRTDLLLNRESQE